jgi:hypothetical protein
MLCEQVAEGRGGGQAGSSVVFLWGGGPGAQRVRQTLPGGVSEVRFLLQPRLQDTQLCALFGLVLWASF